MTACFILPLFFLDLVAENIHMVLKKEMCEMAAALAKLLAPDLEDSSEDDSQGDYDKDFKKSTGDRFFGESISGELPGEAEPNLSRRKSLSARGTKLAHQERTDIHLKNGIYVHEMRLKATSPIKSSRNPKRMKSSAQQPRMPTSH
ncbi:hypothetical protein P154DRAFT_617135 [Amniculicola lignicola CBS 123094]|uniref:Uncharacterized protein n=1 Tax=Amniculicola lignicola CBS 123094 TaxID=1392246 RepID=A0A6A5WQV0_9PLEO|nr:hypothetical protein P154DRAFT_617135 [Amniculicola lignicola CBS 123094]